MLLLRFFYAKFLYQIYNWVYNITIYEYVKK